MSRRGLIAANNRPPLYIYTGVDTQMRLELVDGVLVCRDSGGAGEHEDLGEWNDPPLLLGYPACYYALGNIEASNEEIIERPYEYFTNIWALEDPLPLEFAPSEITALNLVGSGRDWVPVNDDNATSDNWIYWGPDTILINDSSGGSTMYCIKINF